MFISKGLTAKIWPWSFPALLFGCIFIAHLFSGAPPYFADGPAHIEAARLGINVIQPPGYWLYTSVGGLFKNPGLAFSFFNYFFVSAGPVAFYFMSRKLDVDITCSRIASIAYACIFFLWFAGDVQSTYASQAFFPPLLIFSFLLLKEKQTSKRRFICALIYACGAGFRPSDGFFLIPLLLYLTYSSSPQWKIRIEILVMTGLLCLLWFIPNQLALHANNSLVHSQLSKLITLASVLYLGITVESLANMARVLVPLAIAFWPLIFLFRFISKKNWQLIILWSMPGLLFLFFLYMSDATYIVFSSGAFILAASLSQNVRLAKIVLSACAIWNLGFYFVAKPILSMNPLALAFNYYGVKYTYFGIAHEWMENPSDALNKSPWYGECIKTSCAGVLGTR